MSGVQTALWLVMMILIRPNFSSLFLLFIDSRFRITFVGLQGEKSRLNEKGYSILVEKQQNAFCEEASRLRSDGGI